MSEVRVLKRNDEKIKWKSEKVKRRIGIIMKIER